jgi:hypothetical protein
VHGQPWQTKKSGRKRGGRGHPSPFSTRGEGKRRHMSIPSTCPSLLFIHSELPDRDQTGSILRLAPPSESGCASDGFRANSAWPSPSRVYLLSLSPLAGGGLQSPVQSQPEAVQRLCRSRPRHTTQALRLQGPHRVQSRHAGSHPLPPPPKGACAAAPPTPLPSPSISPSVRSRQGAGSKHPG